MGRWISEDPIGFEAGDANLCRYVGNSATLHLDPTGTVDLSAFTTDELETALAKAERGLEILEKVAATGESLRKSGGKQGGNPAKGAKDPVWNAYEGSWINATWDLLGLWGGTCFWVISWPVYHVFSSDPPTFFTIWALNEIPRQQHFIDLIKGELERRASL